MATVTEIAERHGRHYLRRFGNKVLPSHRRALFAMARCQTGRLGTSRSFCTSCGATGLKYHSCHNRSCPTCSYGRTEDWVERQRARLLPVPYFHLVFTVPDGLRPLFRQHQRDLYPLLFRAAADTLLTVLADNRFLGGKVGVLCVLHTWTQTMVYHPHIHCLVPGVALDDAGRLKLTSNSYLAPQVVLAASFRGRLMTLCKKARPDIAWPKSVWQQRWVVDCRPTLFHTERVLDYLGRYVHRIAISNARILEVTDTYVTFRYTDRAAGKQKRITLHPHDFLSRFLQHVLPNGLHKVRHYGLLSLTHRQTLEQIKTRLADQAFIAGQNVATDEPPQPRAARKPRLMGCIAYLCPACGKQTRIFTQLSLPRARASPEDDDGR